MTEPEHGQWEWEWVAEDSPPFRVVCTGKGRHAERQLAAFPVSQRFGLIASSAPIGGTLGGKTLGAPAPGRQPLHARKPSYQVVYDGAGEITHRAFHCRVCHTPYLMPEAEFTAGITMFQQQVGDLSGRGLDLSSPGATLL